MANFVIVNNPNDLRYVKDHFIFPHRSPFVTVIKHPDLSMVKNVLPIYWKLWGNMIIEMTPDEKEQKNIQLKDKNYKDNMRILYPLYMKLFSLLVLGGLGYLTWLYNK